MPTNKLLVTLLQSNGVDIGKWTSMVKRETIEWEDSIETQTFRESSEIIFSLLLQVSPLRLFTAAFILQQLRSGKITDDISEFLILKATSDFLPESKKVQVENLHLAKEIPVIFEQAKIIAKEIADRITILMEQTLTECSDKWYRHELYEFLGHTMRNRFGAVFIVMTS